MSPEETKPTTDQQSAVEFSLLKDKKILIVEDDKFLHELLRDKLIKFGSQITSAFDGESGVENANGDFDIILLDIILPGMSGFDVLKSLREKSEIKNIPIIILSNLGQEDDIKKGLEFGATDFLIKADFTLDEIVRKIDTVLSKNGVKK